LLQRAHIVAGEHIPIGKESDRHWEEGEDISLLEFKAIRYKCRGKVTATPEQLQRIEKVPKREFIRRGINQHTLEKICNRVPVRASRLAKVVKVLREWEGEQASRTIQRIPRHEITKPFSSNDDERIRLPLKVHNQRPGL
jgi:hypothetical protein